MDGNTTLIFDWMGVSSLDWRGDVPSEPGTKYAVDRSSEFGPSKDSGRKFGTGPDWHARVSWWSGRWAQHFLWSNYFVYQQQFTKWSGMTTVEWRFQVQRSLVLSQIVVEGEGERAQKNLAVNKNEDDCKTDAFQADFPWIGKSVLQRRRVPCWGKVDALCSIKLPDQLLVLKTIRRNPWGRRDFTITTNLQGHSYGGKSSFMINLIFFLGPTPVASEKEILCMQLLVTTFFPQPSRIAADPNLYKVCLRVFL